MKISRLALALATVAFPVAALAQTAPEFSADRVRGHIEFLASDALEGRDAGTRGYDVAAEYVASQFLANGLKPGNNGSWFQQVPLLRTTYGEAPGRVVIGDRTFTSQEDIIVGANPRAAQQMVEAPVVFVGYGLDAPELGFNDYAGLDVRGKIVAVLSGVPKGTPSEVGAHLGSDKARVAAEKGAIGTIQILTTQESARRPWSVRTQYARHPSYTWVGPDNLAFTRNPNIRAASILNQPAAEALFAGSRRSLAQVLAEADKEGGKPKGFALKQTARIEVTTEQTRATSPNVVGIIPGSDPALANEYVLLMAHLDHDGVDPDAEGEDKIYNGAMDNASGTATMIEVARAFAESGTRPKRSILFAAVTAEEDGLLGSQYLAMNPVVGNGKVVGVVNLDMPILLYDFQDVVAFGAEHSTLGPMVQRAAESMNVKLSPDPLPQEGLFTRSDHYRFVQEGIPSVFLMTGFAGEGQEKFSNFLANNYHKVSDQTDLPFNWDAGAKFARINYHIAREIADAPQAPRWYADSFFGKVFAGDQPKAQRPN